MSDIRRPKARPRGAQLFRHVSGFGIDAVDGQVHHATHSARLKSA